MIEMKFTRTTPSRPVDVTAVFPELAPLARAAVRLHPRPGSPSVHESSVGGPLRWPADEPWPHCDRPHPDSGTAETLTEIRLRHVESRLRRDPDDPRHGPEEKAIRERLERLREGVGTGGGPVAMLPVAQLYVRDVPLLRPPGNADLLQVLWCPFDHYLESGDYMPSTALFWRSAREIVDVLTAPPEPFEAQSHYVPQPCLLAPEPIVEYPNPLELGQEARQRLQDPDGWRTVGEELDRWQTDDVDPYPEYPEDFYRDHLSTAPGWKVGGRPHWGLTDPGIRHCTACETEMVPLLNIDSREWNSIQHSWIPHEDQAPEPCADDADDPTKVQIFDLNHLQFYICPHSSEHPHTAMVQ